MLSIVIEEKYGKTGHSVSHQVKEFFLEDTSLASQLLLGLSRRRINFSWVLKDLLKDYWTFRLKTFLESTWDCAGLNTSLS